MGAKAKTVRKKKNISKHVMKARETTTSGDQPIEAGIDQSLVDQLQPPKETPEKRKKGKNRHVKDPSEAASYLNEWNSSKNGSVHNWKFNKNTQSWLIRHMYEVDKIPKSEFSLLLEYLGGLEGKTSISRIRSEASRRALRYKDHEKKISAKKTDDNEVKTEPESESKPDIGKAVKSDATQDEEVEEQARWQKMSENDKRKEYKRARKILDTCTIKD